MTASRRSFYLFASIVAVTIAFCGIAGASDDADKKPGSQMNWDMVSDTVATTFDKANALLSGNLDIKMDKKTEERAGYTVNAIGQRVPRKTAVKAAGSLHNDEPL